MNGSRHAVMLVSDLNQSELTQLAGIVSLPLAERLADVISDGPNTAARLFDPPVQESASYSPLRLSDRLLREER